MAEISGGEGASVPPKTPMGTGTGGHAPGQAGAPDKDLTGQDK